MWQAQHDGGRAKRSGDRSDKGQVPWAFWPLGGFWLEPQEGSYQRRPQASFRGPDHTWLLRNSWFISRKILPQPFCSWACLSWKPLHSRGNAPYCFPYIHVNQWYPSGETEQGPSQCEWGHIQSCKCKEERYNRQRDSREKDKGRVLDKDRETTSGSKVSPLS